MSGKKILEGLQDVVAGRVEFSKPTENTGSPKRHWSNGIGARIAGQRIAVGSDIHLLEMANAERAQLTAENERLRKALLEIEAHAEALIALAAADKIDVSSGEVEAYRGFQISARASLTTTDKGEGK